MRQLIHHARRVRRSREGAFSTERATSSSTTRRDDELAQFSESLLSAFSDEREAGRPTVAARPRAAARCRTLADVDAVHAAMEASDHARRLGGVRGWKLGWKDLLAERHALSGPLFGAGFLRDGAEVSLARHKVRWCRSPRLRAERPLPPFPSRRDDKTPAG